MRKKLYGLLGRTLGHSYSAQIHALLGNSEYRLIELEPEQLAEFFENVDIGGVNVTIPYKRDVMEYCHELSPEASQIGSVNTIVRGEDGALRGYNTDAYGLEFMARRAGIDFAGRKTLIFGSGGASLTAQAVARANGADEIIIISRAGSDNYDNINRHFGSRILINATPVGMYPNAGGAPADPADFPECEGVLDMVYNPRRTAFLMRARELNIPNSGGLPMLVAQAKAAEELFFGKAIPNMENERILRQIGRDMENIVLIGMPGSGKSALGKLLGHMTGREVIDMDEEIVKAAGCSIQEIFDRDGQERFRQLEREETARIGGKSGKVIVTGGGVVTDERNYLPLHRNGRIYHITRDIEKLARDGRPLSLGADLNEMYAQRLPMYIRFRDAQVDNNGQPQDTAELIWREFCENTGD